VKWHNLQNLPGKNYRCGYCTSNVASEKGWYAADHSIELISLRICPMCEQPSFFKGEAQRPGVPPGSLVLKLPEHINSLYNEARMATSVGAHTASVLACRKLLMNIAVEQGAKEGNTFVSYIEHLAGKGYIPPNGRSWVDHIRTTGNEATHEIRLMTKKEAEDLISFSELLLKFVFEFPARVPTK
jgi:Domain of unknown function (DUF4145)